VEYASGHQQKIRREELRRTRSTETIFPACGRDPSLREGRASCRIRRARPEHP